MNDRVRAEPLRAPGSNPGQPVRRLEGLPILMYHSISPTAAPGFARFAMHPGDFAAHMAFIADAGYQAITISEAMALQDRRQQLPERAVVLTFDDGFDDFHTTALPILREYRLRATLYVTTGYVGRTGRWLADCDEQDRVMIGWSQLREAAAEGVEIGAHSHTHPQLDRLEATRLADEIRRPKALLEDRLGVAVKSFAYPFGYWDRTTRRAVAKAGYDSACGVDDLPARTGRSRLALPRLTVDAGTSVEQLRQLLLIRPSRAGVAAVPVRRVLWRTLRRSSHVHPQWRDPRS
ncbi:MAG: polysaccharide deacetylase family protein [Actinomycetota bacterium]